MTTLLIAVLIVVGLVIRSMTWEERKRHIQTAIAAVLHIKQEITRPRPELEPYNAALHARMPRVLLTPALIAVNVVIFGGLLFGAGSMSDPQTLIGWGANYGTVTTNGEWWRLFTAMFVNAGLFQLLVAMLSLWHVGNVVERLIGRLTMGAVYVAGGLFAALLTISARPLAPSFGASGSVFALYGFLAAATSWMLRKESDLRMPPLAMRRFALTLTLLALFSLFSSGLAFGGHVAAFIVGLAAGAVLGKDFLEAPPQPKRLAMTFGAILVGAIAWAIPLRGITDARPEIARLVSTEDKTAGAYKSAVDAFRKGKMSAEAMAQLIDRTIMPELQAAEKRIKSLSRVPSEQQPMVETAEEYLKLRRESWRLRAEGLRKSKAPARTDSTTTPTSDANWRLRAEAQYRANVVALGKAEGTERASLEALDKIRQ